MKVHWDIQCILCVCVYVTVTNSSHTKAMHLLLHIHVVNMKRFFSGSSFDTDEEIKNGAIDIIYASPETLVGDQDWRSSIKNLNVKVIVVDEFHTIATWYVYHV